MSTFLVTPDLSLEHEFLALYEEYSQAGEQEWCAAANEAQIGTLRIRHYLTPAVEERAGHIGYDISPSHRGQGYGHQILALAIDKIRELGIREALAICDQSNTPSKRILEKAGGVVTKIKNGEIWYILKS